MLLIVGLGNPGKEYENTPHNMGRDAVLRFIARAGLPPLTHEKKFKALISCGIFGEQKLIAALPETFMNLSGEAVSAIAAFHKIPTENVWVLHDDIDIPLGSVRVAWGGGAAGHHGVESIAEKLGAPDFWRFRIGIKPQEPLVLPLDTYVLRKNAIASDAHDASLAKAETLLQDALARSIAEAQKSSD